MFINTKTTIENSPYTSLIQAPPTVEHTATFIVVSFVERGSLEMDIASKSGEDKKLYVLNENDCVIIMPFTVLTPKKWTTKNYLQRNIYIDEVMFKECCDIVSPSLYKEFIKNDYPFQFKLSSSALVYLAEICSLISREDNANKKEIHKCLIFTLLTQYISTKIEKNILPIWIRALLRNLDNREFLLQSVEDMIVSTNYSHGYVNREFKKYMSMSLKQYVLRRKLAISTSFLATTDMSIQEIVDSLNFCNVSNYINMFKQHYSVTPAKYRRLRKVNVDTDSYQEWGNNLTF